uniref:Neprilysin-like protein 13 n=1 Tax=Ampulex compressa TaxID=860918 RepID=A0A1W6EWC8_AMPCP|nr:neprilysin-like protein 13 [Ampulex compressa]
MTFSYAGLLTSALYSELHYNFRGSKNVWWSSAMLNKYASKEKCFAEEYSQYPIIELEEELGIIYNNGARTATENIADAMGLKAAYLAFQKRLEKMEGECPMLPHFAKFTCEQLFFISFANTFCMAMRPFALLKHVQENHHSTSRTRVNGAVSNMPEFSKAFNCKPNSFLNPKKKCDVWE